MTLSVKGFTVAVAVIWAGLILLVGLGGLIWPGYGAAFLEAVASIYPGYEASGSVGSVIVGTLYGLVDGAVGGAIFAWLYNLVSAPTPGAPTP